MEPWYNEENRPLLVRVAELIKRYYLWLTAIVSVFLLIWNDYPASYYIVVLLIIGYLSILGEKLDTSNQELINLNEKFAVNQRKLSKSIKDHNDLVSSVLLEQKELFNSIVNPSKKDNN